MRLSISCSLVLAASAILSASSCKKSSSGSTSVTGSDSAKTIYTSTIGGVNGPDQYKIGATGVAVDPQGNLYASINGEGDILKISPSGVVSNFAGTNGNFGCEAGTGASATFTNPYSISADAQGNLYVADYLCFGIKKITPAGTSTQFCINNSGNGATVYPISLCLDPAGNVYSLDQVGSDGISVTSPGGTYSRLAGSTTNAGTYLDGPVATAEFYLPSGICADGNGNVYVADAHRIRKISGGQVTTVAGNQSVGFSNGKGAAATFGGAMGLCMGPDGNIYIADIYNSLIRMMTPDGTVSTVAGSGTAGLADGPPAVAQFNQPSNLCFDANGNLYVADYGNAVVRKITFPK